MNLHGIEVDIRRKPELEPGFLPLHRFNEAFLRTAKKPVALALERADGQMASVYTFVHGTEAMREADCYYIERLVKTLLWMKGGFRVILNDETLCRYLQSVYCAGGEREFDWRYMANIFEHPFEIVYAENVPETRDDPKAMGGHLQGCRIGFDAGGSDRKVSAVIDGEAVFSEEVVWFPKQNPDPAYHYEGIVSAFRSAAAHLPRVDAVGISAAGIHIKNRTMNASLFLKVPPERDGEVKDIFRRAVRDTFGDVPFEVVNDGDVTALAGSMSLREGNVLGIAMGTCEAAGFVDREGRVTGWLNELAFAPVDASPDATLDEWSGDIGVGCRYFSQDAVIRLAPAAGIGLDDSLSPAEKLKAVQELMAQGDMRAAKIYESIGVCLGHVLAHYHALYGFRHVLLLGRVMSGPGGDLLLETCKSVLAEEYPEVFDAILPALPDERFRRLGQSVAAASLPEVFA